MSKANVVGIALKLRNNMLVMLETKILGFEMIKGSYESNDDFKE